MANDIRIKWAELRKIDQGREWFYIIVEGSESGWKFFERSTDGARWFETPWAQAMAERVNVYDYRSPTVEVSGREIAPIPQAAAGLRTASPQSAEPPFLCLLPPQALLGEGNACALTA